MASLPLVPLDDAVVFPGMPVTIPAISGNDRRVLLIPRRGVGYARVGVVAEVTKRHTIRGTAVMSLDALHRGVPGIAHGDQDGVLRVEVHEHPDVAPPQELTADLEREYRAVVEEILELRGDDGRVSAFLRAIVEPGPLADTAGYSPDLSTAQKLELLETLDVVQRLGLSLKFQRERLAELQVRKRIREDVENGAQKQQRDYFLRKQMDAIRKELGENEASVTEDYRKKIAEAGMPENVQQQAERELSRFERLGDQSAESSVIRTYLDWLIAVPWSKRSDERLDPNNAREVLDADHAGLEDVKDRITEYLAVRKLRTDRGMSDTKRSGVILTLVGPPGTGKTSIGESIARTPPSDMRTNLRPVALAIDSPIEVLPVPGGPTSVRMAPERLSSVRPRSLRSLRTARYSVMRALTSSRPEWSASSTSRAFCGSMMSSDRLDQGTASSQSR